MDRKILSAGFIEINRTLVVISSFKKTCFRLGTGIGASAKEIFGFYHAAIEGDKKAMSEILDICKKDNTKIFKSGINGELFASVMNQEAVSFLEKTKETVDNLYVMSYEVDSHLLSQACCIHNINGFFEGVIGKERIDEAKESKTTINYPHEVKIVMSQFDMFSDPTKQMYECLGLISYADIFPHESWVNMGYKTLIKLPFFSGFRHEHIFSMENNLITLREKVNALKKKILDLTKES